METEDCFYLNEHGYCTYGVYKFKRIKCIKKECELQNEREEEE